MQPNQNVQNIPQESVDLSKYQTICEIENGFFHEFATQKYRELVDICNCQILTFINVEGTEVPQYFIRIGDFLQNLESSIWVMAKFQNLVTFVFQNKQSQHAIYLLSFESFNSNLDNFVSTLKQAVQIVDYKTDNYEKTSLREKIVAICEGDLTEEMIQSTGYLGNILKTVGGILGSVAKNIADPVAKTQVILNNGVQMLSEKISPENRTKWNNFKEKASDVNEKMTEMYKPIDNVVRAMMASIGQSFNNSNNTWVKNLKKYGKATAKTINDSYQKAEQQIFGLRQKENEANTQQAHEQSTNNLNM